jgi:hypothetical protein
VGVVLEEQLLQVEEGALVGHVLTHLDDGVPGTLRVVSFTVLTLLIALHKLHNSRLLHDGTIHHFFLHSDFDLETHGMWFCPNPHCINKFELEYRTEKNEV